MRPPVVVSCIYQKFEVMFKFADRHLVRQTDRPKRYATYHLTRGLGKAGLGEAGVGVKLGLGEKLGCPWMTSGGKKKAGKELVTKFCYYNSVVVRNNYKSPIWINLCWCYDRLAVHYRCVICSTFTFVQLFYSNYSLQCLRTYLSCPSCIIATWFLPLFSHFSSEENMQERESIET